MKIFKATFLSGLKYLPFRANFFMIDFRSDTVTRPTPAMREAMMGARVGDDVFGEDPTIQELEQKMAALFHLPAALFCPSGTMTNQIAIKAHTRPGEEVICSDLAHVYVCQLPPARSW